MKFDENGRLVPNPKAHFKWVETGGRKIYYVSAAALSDLLYKNKELGQIALTKVLLLGGVIREVGDATCGPGWWMVSYPGYNCTERNNQERAALEFCLIYDIPLEVTHEAE